jgi:hypothetical protein
MNRAGSLFPTFAALAASLAFGCSSASPLPPLSEQGPDEPPGPIASGSVGTARDAARDEDADGSSEAVMVVPELGTLTVARTSFHVLSAFVVGGQFRLNARGPEPEKASVTVWTPVAGGACGPGSDDVGLTFSRDEASEGGRQRVAYTSGGGAGACSVVFTSFGPVGAHVTGRFSATLSGGDGAEIELEASFEVVRGPDG